MNFDRKSEALCSCVIFIGKNNQHCCREFIIRFSFSSNSKKNWHWIELLKLSILLHTHKCPSSLCIFERFKWSRIIFFVRSFFIFISTSETRAWGCVSQKPWFRVNKFRHCHTYFFSSVPLFWYGWHPMDAVFNNRVTRVADEYKQIE